MKSDPIIEDVWKIKEAHAAKYGHDIRKMAAALMQEQKKLGDRLVDLSQPKKRAA